MTLRLIRIISIIVLLEMFLSCKPSPAAIKMEVIDWKAKNIDSIEVLYYPDYLKQKNYNHRIINDSNLNNKIRSNILTDTISIQEESYQYKLYLINQGEPFKTLYISTIKGKQFLSYVINGDKVYHPLQEHIDLALQE